MTYDELFSQIQTYTENQFPDTFVQVTTGGSQTNVNAVTQINTFITQAEERIYNTVQIPALRRNVTGSCTANNKYLACPNDYLSTFSMAVVDADGNYEYLLNKDVNFLRESYPAATLVNGAYQGTPGGVPKYYALFGPQYGNTNELSFIMAPTPDASYPVEMHYFYYPVSIVQGQIATFYNPVGGSLYTNGNYQNIQLTGGNGSGAVATITIAGNAVTSVVLNDGGSFYIAGDVLSASTSDLGGTGSGFTITVATANNANGTSWLGDNFDPVLLYGSMREAILFMKGEQDMVGYYEQKYAEGIQQLKRLGDGLERNDSYRKGQTSLPYNQL